MSNSKDSSSEIVEEEDASNMWRRFEDLIESELTLVRSKVRRLIIISRFSVPVVIANGIMCDFW
jgi:hypothetical protein